MTAIEREWPLAPAPPPAAHRFRLLVLLGAGFVLAYGVATVAGAPGSALDVVFTSVMLGVPPVAWWAYVRAPDRLRQPFHLLAWAATLWLAGSVVWEAFYRAAGNKVPHPPGVWDLFFITAQLLVIAALLAAMRSFISARLATLDAIVVTAAGIALGAPFVRHGLEHGANAGSIVTLNRPILSVVVLMIIASAALGTWEGLPLSLGMLGLSEVALTVGNLVYAFEAVQNRYVDARWATLAWGAGAVLAMLTGSVLVLQVDRPIRVFGGHAIPDHAAGSRSVLLISVAGLAISASVACFGLLVDSRSLALVGLSAASAIGAAMALRARESLWTAERAYERLDRALAETERTRDALEAANERLARANAELRAMHVTLAELLTIADEQTHGEIRALLESAGRELAEVLGRENVLANGDARTAPTSARVARPLLVERRPQRRRVPYHAIVGVAPFALGALAAAAVALSLLLLLLGR